MTDDIKAAAERLCKNPHQFEYHTSGQCVEDMRTLSRAYLAEHDKTLIDEDWLRSVGFVDWVGEGGSRSLGIGLPMTMEWGSLNAEMTIHEKHLPNTTRGDVRRLADALGVVLKETSNGN